MAAAGVGVLLALARLASVGRVALIVGGGLARVGGIGVRGFAVAGRLGLRGIGDSVFSSSGLGGSATKRASAARRNA